MSLIVSAVTWVKRAQLAAFPRQAEDEEEAYMRDAEAVEARKKAVEQKKAESADTQMEEDAAIIAEFGLDTYDDENDERMMVETYYENPEDDPNLADLSDDSDAEEATVLDDDLVVLAAVTETEDNFSHLDMHIYEARDRNMFCHHDYMLPAFPLALSYLSTVPGGVSESVRALPNHNFVAVGTMEPAIEIWDLDVIDAVECVATLGGVKKEGTKKKKPVFVEGSHTDSVLSLDWNKTHTQFLASGSADKTVKFWDIPQLKPVVTFDSLHTDKVQAVQWCHAEPTILLSTSYDRTCAVVDVRTPQTVLRWKLPADPECIQWVPGPGYRFLVSTENGEVRLFDAAQGIQGGSLDPVWTIAAHDKACSALSVNPYCPGLIATGSLDRTVKLWSVKEKPTLLYSQNINNSVYSMSFCEDTPSLLAIGASTGVRVWDVQDLHSVRRGFPELYAKCSPMTDMDDDDDDDETKKKGGLREVCPPGQGPETEKKKKEKAMEKKAAMPARPRMIPGPRKFAKGKLPTKQFLQHQKK